MYDDVFMRSWPMPCHPVASFLPRRTEYILSDMRHFTQHCEIHLEWSLCTTLRSSPAQLGIVAPCSSSPGRLALLSACSSSVAPCWRSFAMGTRAAGCGKTMHRDARCCGYM